MEMIGYGKSAIWTGITVLLSLLDANVIAQQGFLSIDCGGKTNYTDENNILWVTDHNYIDVGEIANTGSSNSPSYLQTLRFFPNPLSKSCYQLPTALHVPYLLRLQFSVGNYSKFSGSDARFTFTLEASGLLSQTVRTLQSVYEKIFFSNGTVLFVCLIKTKDTVDPFINAIELRALRNGMYGQAKPGTALTLRERINVGGNSPVRYPLDNFDRIWNITLTDPFHQTISTREPISSNNTKNLPPTAVMQTAWVMNIDDFPFTPIATLAPESLLLLYFAEIERLNISEYRSFYVRRTGEDPSATITLVRNYSALELTFISKKLNKFAFDLVEAPNSTRRPIINAYEYYAIHDTWPATSSHDIEALDAIKSKYGIKDWISDPCYYIPWKGLGCINSSSPVRISEINFSGRNLTGSLAEEIGQLSALISVTLDNNNLIGPLPNLSGLNMLERLHLQNNSFSGILPVWLFKLKNLEELFIQNNNFSGVIPAELLDRTSMNIKYSGNKYFCIMYKAGDCIQEIQKTKNKSKTVVLGIIISGCLIALMVGIAVYWRKKRETQRLNQDYTLIMSKLTNFRAFTGKEMVEATENFSRQIGQGDSGLVFSGKLREENHDILIAVKMLSSLPYFLNEVTVISRAQHENLVSLVGYCSESKNLMLIYEYMSGGSLWRSLHDTSAGHSNLNWKTRLNIALDVANGLEFLHVGCTPKIIHMDVKTANILLDSNKRAKLADFGLSRIATDGEASHATMTKANGTHGYIDPEYRLTHRVTEKSDVYSFGVVLFEIISGKRVTNANDEEEFNLVEWVTPKVRNEDVDAEIIDERLAGNYDKKSIVRVANVALRCVKDSFSWRPSISEVVGEIKEAIIDETENNAQFPVSEEIGIEH